MGQRVPKVGDKIQVRVYRDIWVPGTILGAEGWDVDIEDDDGGSWHYLGQEHHPGQWRWVGEVKFDKARVKTGIPARCSKCGHMGNIFIDTANDFVLTCLKAGARGERGRIVRLIAERCAPVAGGGAWTVSPKELLEAIGATDIDGGEVELATPPTPEAL